MVAGDTCNRMGANWQRGGHRSPPTGTRCRSAGTRSAPPGARTPPPRRPIAARGMGRAADQADPDCRGPLRRGAVHGPDGAVTVRRRRPRRERPCSSVRASPDARTPREVRRGAVPYGQRPRALAAAPWSYASGPRRPAAWPRCTADRASAPSSRRPNADRPAPARTSGPGSRSCSRTSTPGAGSFLVDGARRHLLGAARGRAPLLRAFLDVLVLPFTLTAGSCGHGHPSSLPLGCLPRPVSRRGS